jgi:hypothetical protein
MGLWSGGDGLQERQSDYREEAAGVVDFLQDGAAGETFDTSMVVREVGEEEAESGDAVVDAVEY